MSPIMGMGTALRIKRLVVMILLRDELLLVGKQTDVCMAGYISYVDVQPARQYSLLAHQCSPMLFVCNDSMRIKRRQRLCCLQYVVIQVS